MARNETKRSHMRYGVCLNDSCSKSRNKVIQEIPARKEMICEECQKPLRECPPPKKSNKGLMIGGVGAAAAVAAVLGFLFIPKGDKAPENEPVNTPPVVQVPDADTVDTVPTEPTETISLPEVPADLDLGYGLYYGDVQNGVPHGNGEIIYTKATKIVSSKDYVAQPGEKVQGSFRNGKLNMGKWYQANGNETVIMN